MNGLTGPERGQLRDRLESWFGDPRQSFLVIDLAPVVEEIIAAREKALAEKIVALTWSPAVCDTVSGTVSPPRRKTHVRVRDIDAALAREQVTP